MPRLESSVASRNDARWWPLTAVLFLVPAPAIANEVPGQKTFERPEEAVRALADAARRADSAAMLTILGPEAQQVVSSGDAVTDAEDREWFASVAGASLTFQKQPNGEVIAQVGREAWPFPIPLVKSGDRWRFDTPAGKDELLSRRIGRNELTAISVARAYVAAQRQYATKDRTGSGKRTYAQKFRSEPGKHDGLYWDPIDSERSPLGPLVADESDEGYAHTQSAEGPRPYHGYLYRILTAQGPSAQGGARSYVKDGQMTGGFALVAYPAVYRSSGRMTFIVGSDDIVLQKDLGDKTAELGKAMTAYDPDETWTLAREAPPAPVQHIQPR
jgi:Protein of unknown function (DUF2950)